jgi:hypothetical protein
VKGKILKEMVSRKYSAHSRRAGEEYIYHQDHGDGDGKSGVRGD